MICSARHVFMALVGGLALSLASCSRSDHKPVYPVTGSVLYQAKPAEGAQVVFVPLDNDDPKMPRPGARVKKNGSFRLSTYAVVRRRPPRPLCRHDHLSLLRSKR